MTLQMTIMHKGENKTRSLRFVIVIGFLYYCDLCTFIVMTIIVVLCVYTMYDTVYIPLCGVMCFVCTWLYTDELVLWAPGHAWRRIHYDYIHYSLKAMCIRTLSRA